MSNQMDHHGGDCSSEAEQEAKDRLRRSSHSDIRELSCHCVEGVLFLRGRLSSFHQKQLAQEAVGGIDGVRRVVNESGVVASSRDG